MQSSISLLLAALTTLIGVISGTFANVPITPNSQLAQVSTNQVYTVKKDGTGDFVTIQACVDVAKPRETCLVHAGNYDEIVASRVNGTSNTSRIILKAEGSVTVRGIDLNHQYITIDGFDITGTNNQYTGYIDVRAPNVNRNTPGGNYCEILNNTIRDGAVNVQGILFYTSGGVGPNNCVIRGNKLSNLNYVFTTTGGDNHLFENNVFEYQNSMDYVRLFGSNHVFRRNIFWKGSTKTGTGNHPDFVQTFGASGNKSENHLFEENWITDLQSQFSQMNSGDGIVSKGILYDNVKNVTFRRNVIANISANANKGIPGVKFENNTFYRMAYELSGIGFSGSLTRSNSKNGTLKNNVFLAGGSRPSNLNDGSGFYSSSGASLSREVIAVFVTNDPGLGTSDPVTRGIYDNLRDNAYIGANGNILPKATALSDISEFVLDSQYEVYKAGVYDVLIKTVEMDNEIRSTFYANYNYVAGSPEAGYPKKRDSGCDWTLTFTAFNFCEKNGINGGDPKLANLSNLLGPDGIPFTLDDGLKPQSGSPLCGKGEGGIDIGAYSCDPNIVFAGSTTGPTPPDTTPPSIPQNLSANPVSSSEINLSWSASTDNVGVAGYRLERCQGSTCNNFVQISSPSSTSYSDINLVTNTTYRYRVRAQDGVGNLSNYSNIVNATTQQTQTTTYTIQSSAGAGGTISPSGTITVNQGSSQTFNISANSGYQVANVVVNDVNQGAISTYTFSNITSNHTIGASFSITTTESPPPPPPPSTTKFNIGQRIKTTSKLNVRGTPTTSGKPLGSQESGAIGTILSGPVQAVGYTWWSVDYDISPDGYSVENYLEAYTSPTPKFNLGDRVYTTNSLRVRSTPTTKGRSLCTQPVNSYGTTMSGPLFAEGYYWWEINYDFGCNGWSAQDWLAK
jgi:hypothetical protein